MKFTQFTEPSDFTEPNIELDKPKEAKIEPEKSRKYSSLNIRSKPLNMSELEWSNIGEQRTLNIQQTQPIK